MIDRWQSLVIRHDVKGKQEHDTRLVAAMLRHGVDHLLTVNAADFTRYSEISVSYAGASPSELALRPEAQAGCLKPSLALPLLEHEARRPQRPSCFALAANEE